MTSQTLDVQKTPSNTTHRSRPKAKAKANSRSNHNNNNNTISYHSSSNSDSNIDSPRLSDGASSTPTSLDDEFMKLSPSQRRNSHNKTDDDHHLIQNDNNNNKKERSIINKKPSLEDHHPNPSLLRMHSSSILSNVQRPHSQSIDPLDIPKNSTNDSIDMDQTIPEESIKKDYHPWKSSQDNNDVDLSSFDDPTTTITDEDTTTHNNEILQTTSNLIHTDSYIHNEDTEDHIILNTKVSRRSSKRRDTQDSIRTTIPFHASKHSQILPLDESELNPHHHSIVQRKKLTHHSMSSLPIPCLLYTSRCV